MDNINKYLGKVQIISRVPSIDLSSLDFFSDGTGVNGASSVMNNLLDDSLSLQVDQSATSDGAVDTETIDQDTDGDEFVGGDFLHELVISGLVHNDGVLGLLLGLSLGPLLLFTLSTSACRFSSRSLIVREGRMIDSSKISQNITVHKV